MNIFGGSFDMDASKETSVTSIDIFDVYDSLSPQIPASDSFYRDPSYLRGGDRGPFFIDDIKIVACGDSSNDVFVIDQSNTFTTPFIQMFLGENLILQWSQQYYKMPGSTGNVEVSGIGQCLFSPSGKLILAQFKSDKVSIAKTYKDVSTIGVIDSVNGKLLKSYYMKHLMQENGNMWTGFQSDFQIQFISDTKIFAVYTWDTQKKSIVILSFDPMQPDVNPIPTSVRIIGYEPAATLPSLTAIDILALSTQLSDDRKFMYIGGGMKGMASLIKWSVSSRAVTWHYLIHDIIENPYKREKIFINHISQSFNRTNDTNHIAFCARTELLSSAPPEIRALFMYIRENKFSHGGMPQMNLSIYLDTEMKGQCQDLYLDINKLKATVFTSSPSQAFPKIGRSLIFTIPLNITSNMTIQAKKIGQQPSSLIYDLDVKRDFQVKLTGIDRGYFSGRTSMWNSRLAKMGFVASYPTSYRLIHDPQTVDLFLYYSPEHFVPLLKHSFSLVTNSPSTTFFPGNLVYKMTQSPQRESDEDEDEDDYPPFVGTPRIRISFSMAGDTYFKYTIAKEPLYISLKFYQMSSCSDIPLNYSLKVTPELNSNDVITYNGTSLRIYSNDQQMVGGYTIFITANTPNRVNRTAELFLRIEDLKISPIITTAYKAPYFASELIRMINVTYECTRIYQLPQIKDTKPNGKPTIKFQSGLGRQLPNFVTYNDNKLIIAPSETGDIAIHTIVITLSNEYGQAQNYTIFIQVLPYYDLTVNRESKITIDRSGRKDYILQGKRENYPTAQMLRANKLGEVIIYLDYNYSNPELILNEENFLFKITPELQIRWEIKKFSPDKKYVTVQLYFSKPSAVSMSSLQRSKLQMFFRPAPRLGLLRGRILQASSFSSEGLLFYQDTVELPVQLASKDILAFFDKVGSIFQSIATSILASNLSVTLILSCSMQLLWSFFNSMQLLSLIPLMNLAIPSNLYYLCSLISGPLSFKLFDISRYTNRIFHLKPSYPQYNTIFDAFSFSSSVLIVDLQVTLYIMMLTPIIFILIFCLQRCSHKWISVKRIEKRLRKWMQYSFYIRLLVEEFLAVFISSLINVTLSIRQTWGEIFSFSLSIFMIILMILLPIILGFYILKNHKTKESRKKIGKRLGSIYKDVRKDSPMRLLFSALYVVRRIIFAMSTLYLSGNPMLQVMLFHIMSMLQFLYIGLWKPFEYQLQNRIELMNEACILVVSVILPCFTDFLSDETGEIQQVLGYVVISLLALQCTYNIIVQVKDQYFKIKMTYIKIRRCQCFRKWTRVKMLSETTDMEAEFRKHRVSEHNKTSMDVSIPMPDIPNLENLHSKGIHLESLQLFTPRGRNLFGRDSHTPYEDAKDVRLNDMIEEAKEEAEDDAQYYGVEDFHKIERAQTAGQPQNRRYRDNHLTKLNEVATINFDDFFTQFSIMPYENTQLQHRTIGSARIRIIPVEPQSYYQPETENQEPQNNQTQPNHTLSIHSGPTNHTNTLAINPTASTYPTTQPHMQSREYTMAGYTQIETGGEMSRVGSSEGSNSQKSGSSGGRASKTERALKKKPASRIKQHDS